MTALGVLCCFALFVCLTLLASFFLPSHLSFKNMYMAMDFLLPEAAHLFCCFALFVCLTLLASFFLPSHLSFKNMYMAMDFLLLADCLGAFSIVLVVSIVIFYYGVSCV